MTTDPLTTLLAVTRVLEGLEISYFVGGSMASAVHGIARATMDVDLIVKLESKAIQPLLGVDKLMDFQGWQPAAAG